jgi:hypothetical protein
VKVEVAVPPSKGEGGGRGTSSEDGGRSATSEGRPAKTKAVAPQAKAEVAAPWVVVEVDSTIAGRFIVRRGPWAGNGPPSGQQTGPKESRRCKEGKVQFALGYLY